MNRRKKNNIASIVLVTLALIGLVGLQVVLLDNAVELKKQTFRQNVNASIRDIVQKLETGEAVHRTFSVIASTTDEDQLRLTSEEQIGTRVGDVSLKAAIGIVNDTTQSKLWTDGRGDFRLDDDRIVFTLHQPQHVRLRVLDARGDEIDELMNEYKDAGEYAVFVDTTRFEKDDVAFNFTGDSGAVNILLMAGRQDLPISGTFDKSKKRMIVNRVLEDLATLEVLPIEARVEKTTLDSLVKSVLYENGIDTPYEYGIHVPGQDTLKLITSTHFHEELRTSPFRARLFPSELLHRRNDLVFFFPNETLYLLKKSGLLLGSSLFLVAVIAFAFIYTLRTILRQERFAKLLTDFINNMTHEFKTPISTISLASEALGKTQSPSDRTRVARYAQIIQDENQRMRNQVDKILQMAVLEEGDTELNTTDIDLHDSIRTAVDNIALQIESRKGRIECQFSADPCLIEADPVHISNIIHNLLDNASKYSSAAPKIRVSTQNNGEGIQLRIKDNGIGLRPEEQKLIFDKYYRVPTGNLHDVKGSGLGLSYVKLMVEAHGGSIEVRSQPTEGTEFEIFLPYAPGDRKGNNGRPSHPAR